MDSRLSPRTAPTPRATPHFQILDGLRGIAAAVVLFTHACGQAGTLQPFHKPLFAVYFFFMLSGFVVACAYEKRMKTNMTVREFYVRRAIRLYPLIIAGTVLSIAYLLMLEPKFPQDASKYWAIASSFLGLPFPYASFTRHAFPINPPAWSLFYELMAYLVYGVVATRLRTWHLVVAAVASTILFAHWAHYYDGQRITLLAQVCCALAPFTIGILLWRIYEANTWTLPALPFWLLSPIIVALCALPDFDRGFDALIVATIFPLVILSGAAHGSNHSGPVTKTLGDLSYPVYILHWPFVAGLPLVFIDPWRRSALAVTACAMAVAFAWGAYRFYDLPLRNFLTRTLITKRRIERTVQQNLVT